ncbi:MULTISPECIES: hypothetical protein [unclassified Bacillus (in: firmicutes)]|uniref:hypothetical protein n=1 Tax=unclassified Bacillus (in: firmicutes) TaxID=185979 RepID=UPI001BEC4BC4|nr:MULTISPECIES: hypothetical protein [unclassified Bacillus (in: firmicutes)]MBT2725175.1 hypothetical protein [Bacillus sp. ISL-46]MBT2743472.1 hypothetical protein [Bacillus sp. ISL-77]
MGIDKFSAALDLLKGFSVNLYVGEDVFKGKLIGVEADHVVLETENKYIFYYNIDKIQAITKNTREFQPEKTTAKFLKTQSLTDLLLSFQHTWVTILTINKQRFTGVLSEIDTDFATLINGDERILIKLTHVSNILKGVIKEEAVKTSSSNNNEKNNKDSDNKKDSKDHSSSSGDKDDSKDHSSSGDKKDSKNHSSSGDKKDSKNHSSSSGDKKDSKNHSSSSGDKKDSKNHSSSSGDKEDSKKKKQKNSNSKEKSDKKNEEAVKVEVVEPNNTMVWSQPIKIEATMVKTKDELVSNNFKIKKSQTDEKESSKNSTEMKKSNDMSTKDKKSEEAKSTKSISSEQSKEMKEVKEVVSIQKTENPPAPPYKLLQNETKSTKTQEEAAKVVKSTTTQNQATKKAEGNKPNDMNTNSNNQNVWKQKEKEQKVLRFSGEPVNPDSKIAFPFSGWPNRNNRTSRLN